MKKDLVLKYNVPVPRYTSYPTVPYWTADNFSESEWRKAVQRSFLESCDKGIALYVHLPFCESLCTYCACTTRITKNHNVEDRYISTVLQEWEMYRQLIGSTPVIRELHLGGGTPTFFSPENLKRLVNGLLADTLRHPDFEFSFEGHPNNTTEEHLRVLHNAGFRRVSFGVQDLDEKVQVTINRIQPFENVDRVTKISRNVGYQSISFDLVYGLPYQSMQNIESTIQKVITLNPDRIAFYSYAHVPWLKPGQRGYKDADLPTDEAKRQLYESGKELLLNAGFIDIGMDHFARPGDELAIAKQESRLHRNFMGYTTSQSDLLIGLGASAISDARYAYAQNLKKVEEYQESIAQNRLAIFKGHLQTAEDRLVRQCILDLACNGRLTSALLSLVADEYISTALQTMEEEGLIRFDHGIKVTDAGKPFIRNICATFDKRMNSKHVSDQIFSKSI